MSVHAVRAALRPILRTPCDGPPECAQPRLRPWLLTCLEHVPSTKPTTPPAVCFLCGLTATRLRPSAHARRAPVGRPTPLSEPLITRSPGPRVTAPSANPMAPGDHCNPSAFLPKSGISGTAATGDAPSACSTQAKQASLCWRSLTTPRRCSTAACSPAPAERPSSPSHDDRRCRSRGWSR